MEACEHAGSDSVAIGSHVVATEGGIHDGGWVRRGICTQKLQLHSHPLSVLRPWRWRWTLQRLYCMGCGGVNAVGSLHGSAMAVRAGPAFDDVAGACGGLCHVGHFLCVMSDESACLG